MENNNPVQSPTAQVPIPPQQAPPPANQASGMPSFSILEAIKAGWSLTLKNIGFIITVIIGSIVLGTAVAIVLIASIAILSIFINTKAIAAPLGIIVGISLFIIQLVIILGYTKVSLKIIDNQKPEFADLFREYKKVLVYTGATILYALAVLGGLILLIIPGLILAIRLSFYYYLIVDRGVGVIDSLKISWAMTKGQILKLMLFQLVASIIYMLGYLAFGLGLIIATPMVLIAGAYVYRKLLSQSPGI
ncbi:MAG: hypothetical protein AAB521_00775 [Patescibacteria group bacterium]